MNKKCALFLVLCVTSAFALFASDPVEGFWKSIDEKTGEVTAYWKIWQEDGLLFGTIMRVPGEDPSTLATKVKSSYKGFPLDGDITKMKVIGTPWIFSLERKKAGEWTGGSIIDPSNGSMYKCKITFRAKDGKKYAEDSLEMRGEIGLGIGRSQYWVRAKESDWQ